MQYVVRTWVFSDFRLQSRICNAAIPSAKAAAAFVSTLSPRSRGRTFLQGLQVSLTGEWRGVIRWVPPYRRSGFGRTVRNDTVDSRHAYDEGIEDRFTVLAP
uniref:Uncharacterized protein n=1 Tax=Citrifermentans bremense TaxID=60035 RepID=A0A6S6M2C1_9BACT